MSRELASPRQERYISHVEDDPLVLQREFSDMEEAINATCAVITEREDKGSGGVAGMVYDRVENRIVASCNSSHQGVTRHGDVMAIRLNRPDFVQRCAIVVEGFASGRLRAI